MHVTLTDEQLDALADRIAARVNTNTASASGMVDAATLAAHLGVARSYVYAHADELGAVRLGGPRGRLRFALPVADTARHQRQSADVGRPEQRPTTPRRRRRTAQPHVGSILKVRP
jgi:hypothetical protein